MLLLYEKGCLSWRQDKKSGSDGSGKCLVDEAPRMKYGPGGKVPSRKITGATMTLDSTGTSISVLSLGSKSFHDVAPRAVWMILCDTKAVDSKPFRASKL